MISVVIPAYNAEAIIEKALNSVLEQSVRVDEILVINDGSTDGTAEKIEQIKKDFPIPIVSVDQTNSGPSKARNHGVKMAKGDYIAFLDSDDVWDKQKIEKQLEVFDWEPSCTLLGTLTDFSSVPEGDKITKVSFDQMLLSNRIFTSSVLVKKEALEMAGFFREDMRYSEDYNLWLKIAKMGQAIVLNEQLVHYGGGKGVLSNQGLSSNMWAMEKGELGNYREMLQLNYIGTGKYMVLVLFSLGKYLRRRILKLLK